MITEKGTVKTTTVHNENLNRELNRPTRIVGIVYTVIGSVLLALYIVLSAIFGEDLTVDSLLLVGGALLLVLGIICIFAYGKVNKLKGVESKTEENEFFNDYLITREYLNGEHVSTAKVYYHRIVKIKETKSYIFIYNTNVTALAVDKNTVAPQELNTIRSLLARPIPGAAAYMHMPQNQPTVPNPEAVKKEETAEQSSTAEEVKPEESHAESADAEEAKPEQSDEESAEAEEVKTEDDKSEAQPKEE